MSTTVACNSWGAMTTPFVFPAECLFPMLRLPKTLPPSSCAPPNYLTYSTYKNRLGCADAYSPAVCPYGYTMANTLAGPAQLGGRGIEPSETMGFCCPIPFTQAQIDDYCMRLILGATLIYEYAEVVTVRWHQTDLSVLTTAPAVSFPDRFAGQFPIGATPTGSVTITPSITIAGISTNTDFGKAQAPAPNSTSGGDDTGDTGAGGLSTGTKAGIGVACSLGALILIAAFGLFLKYRRVKKAGATAGRIHHDDAPPLTRHVDEKEAVQPGDHKSAIPSALEEVEGENYLVEAESTPEQEVIATGAKPPTSPDAVELFDTLKPSAAHTLRPDAGLEVDANKATQQSAIEPGLEVASLEPGLEVVPPNEDAERATLLSQLQHVQDRRQRLQEMDALAAEEERIRRRLGELK